MEYRGGIPNLFDEQEALEKKYEQLKDALKENTSKNKALTSTLTNLNVDIQKIQNENKPKEREILEKTNEKSKAVPETEEAKAVKGPTILGDAKELGKAIIEGNLKGLKTVATETPKIALKLGNKFIKGSIFYAKKAMPLTWRKDAELTEEERAQKQYNIKNSKLNGLKSELKRLNDSIDLITKLTQKIELDTKTVNYKKNSKRYDLINDIEAKKSFDKLIDTIRKNKKMLAKTKMSLGDNYQEKIQTLQGQIDELELELNPEQAEQHIDIENQIRVTPPASDKKEQTGREIE